MNWMQDHKMRWVIATLLVLLMGGCGTTHKKHDEWMSQADGRWKQMRSGLMLNMAQQQFDTGDLDESEKTVRDAIELDPANPGLHLLAGRIALERGKLERAYGRINNAIKLDPKMALAHYFQGIVLQRWKQLEPALEQYRKAYELQPDNVNYLLATGEMLVATEHDDQALQLLKSSLDYFGQSAGLRAAIGQIYMVRQDYTHAVPFLRQASLMAPDDLQVAEDLATAEFAAGNPLDAMRNFRRLCTEPKLSDRADLFIALGQCYEKLGQFDKAETAYRKVTRAHPEQGEAWIRLGEIALAKNDLNTAALAANRAIKASPDRAQGYLLQGMVSQKRGHTQQALHAFDQAAKLTPQDASPLILRGLALEQAGHLSDAIVEYQQALRREPADQRVRQLLARATSEHETTP